MVRKKAIEEGKNKAEGGRKRIKNKRKALNELKLEERVRDGKGSE